MMLIHANARWPEAVNTYLWPYALRLVCEAFNESPTKKMGWTPVEIFTQSSVMPEFKHWRPFGCPVYVLDQALQNAGGIKEKWSERSRVGVYLGRSPFHARSVALVLNLNTGRVSPQFHVKFDPAFQTMRKAFGGKSPPSHWQAVCGFTDLKPSQVTTTTAQWTEQREPTFTLEPTAEQLKEYESSMEASEGAELPIPGPPTEDPSTPRRSGRVRKPVIGNRLVDALCIEVLQCTTDSRQEEYAESTAAAAGEIYAYSTLFPLHDEVDVDPIYAFAASADPDTLYHHEAMREPDADQFREAMVQEFCDQWNNENFELKRRSEIPEDARILPSVWAMKRK